MVWIFFWRVRASSSSYSNSSEISLSCISFTYFFSAKVGVFGLLFVLDGTVQSVILLKLHRLHLLLDRVHGGGCLLSYALDKSKESERWKVRASADYGLPSLMVEQLLTLGQVHIAIW
jgi:hypothetical protein